MRLELAAPLSQVKHSTTELPKLDLWGWSRCACFKKCTWFHIMGSIEFKNTYVKKYRWITARVYHSRHHTTRSWRDLLHNGLKITIFTAYMINARTKIVLIYIWYCFCALFIVFSAYHWHNERFLGQLKESSPWWIAHSRPYLFRRLITTSHRS